MEKAIFDAINELSSKMDGMETRLTARVNGLDARMDGFDEKLDKMDTKFTRKISSIESDIDGIKRSLEYIKIEQSALRTGLETLDAKIEARIDALEEKNEMEHQIFREALGIAN